MSIKERVEQQIIRELCRDTYLRGLFPSKQNTDTKLPSPSLAVSATPGKEYVITGTIYRVPCTIEARFNSKKSGQDSGILDQIVERVRAKLREAQTRGDYGVVIEGETNRTEGETIRIREVGITVITA